ncbi:MAG: peptidyl-prolyl cis-trans isomerase, partial [Polyangiaceae bacterium]|nr:peptidyl-prolyl cis-trans isomerase [Polyangiaceae bacterium]
REPERRRVAAIVLAKREDAEKVLAQALEDKSAEAWGKLYLASSETAPQKPGAQAPAELQGDLGIVGPPGDAKAANPKIPAAVQRAAFALTDVPTVYGELVEADGKFFVVRLVGRTAGYTRNLEESDKNIRIILRQERVRAREEAMFEDLRKRFPIEVDEQALKSVAIPEAVDRVDAYWERDGGAPAERPDAGP